MAGCASAAADNADAVRDDGSVDLSKVTLTVGDQKGGSKALLRASGALDELPYEVKWKEFTSGPPLLEALNAGAIDIGGVGNTPPLFAAASNSKLVVVAGDTMGAKGDTIVVPEGSTSRTSPTSRARTSPSPRAARPTTTCWPSSTRPASDFDEVDVQYLQPADALAAFSAGHVDAWAIWDPYTAQAEVDEDARVIADGGGVVNGMAFQAANPDSLDDKATAAALEDYVARLAEAKVWSNTHRENWAKVWAEETGPASRGDRPGRQPTGREADRPDDEVIASEQEMADAFVAAKLLPEKFDVKPFFDNRYDDVVLKSARKE